MPHSDRKYTVIIQITVRLVFAIFYRSLRGSDDSQLCLLPFSILANIQVLNVRLECVSTYYT